MDPKERNQCLEASKHTPNGHYFTCSGPASYMFQQDGVPIVGPRLELPLGSSLHSLLGPGH